MREEMVKYRYHVPISCVYVHTYTRICVCLCGLWYVVPTSLVKKVDVPGIRCRRQNGNVIPDTENVEGGTPINFQ